MEVLNCDASWPGHLKFEYGIINVPREDIAHIAEYPAMDGLV